MTTAEGRLRLPSRRTFFMAWALLSLLCAAWAISTPIAAVPDEPAHLIKAASIVRGELVGQLGENGQVVTVPRWVAATHSQACFAFDDAVTADCAEPWPVDPAESVRASTTAGLYNPVYYAIVGLPSLVFTNSSGIFAMRILSGIVTSLFLALAVTLVADLPHRRIALLAMLTAITPMVLFLGGAVNPNGLEIAATLAAFTATLAVVVNPDSRRVASRAAVGAASAAVAVNMRGLSPLWVAIVLSFPLILTTRPAISMIMRHRSVRWMIAVVVSAGLAALGWTVGSGSLVSGTGISPGTDQPEVPFTGASPLRGFYSIIDGTFELGENMVGIFGWLDTPAPAAVYFVWSALIGALLLIAFTFLRGRTLFFSTGLVIAVVVVPALVQAAYITGGGYIWQGRYTMPLFVCAIVGIGVVTGARLPEVRGRSSARLTLVIVVAWTAAQFAAFAVSVRRYSVGLPETWITMIASPAWSPPGGVIPTLLAFALLIVVSASALHRLVAPRADHEHTLVQGGDGTATEQEDAMHEQSGEWAGKQG